MSGLPPALAPWAAQLAGLAPDLAVSLAAWARRLAAAIGPITGAPGRAGEPDGLAGIARRGPYERLLVSEWLLADALPHEFVRRAAAGEHLFFERGVLAERAARRSVALLDAGPDQLGTPRIAQLGMLVVLASRAEAAGVAFAWGVAQDPATELVPGFGEGQVRRFLAARSARAPDAVALRAWSGVIPPPGAPDDLWFVGGPALLALAPPRTSCASIRDVVDPVAREVRVELRRGGARSEVVLPLPARADCTRLLRDPFAAAVAAPVRTPGRIVPEAGVIWSPGGGRVAARLAGGAILDAHVPNSPRGPAGRRKRSQTYGALVGFGWRGRRQWILATRLADQLLLDLGRGDLRKASAEDGVGLPTDAGERSPLAAVLPWPRAEHQLLLHHPGGTLFLVKTGATSPRVTVADTGVEALASCLPTVAYVRRSAHQVELALLQPGGTRLVALGSGTGRAFLSVSPGRAMTAHGDRDGTWTCHRFDLAPVTGEPRQSAQVSLWPAGGTTVVGVTTGDDGRPALLLLGDDRRDFTLLDDGGSRLVHGAPASVVTASVAPARRAFAYTTRTGGLAVFSLQHEATLLALDPGEASEATR